MNESGHFMFNNDECYVLLNQTLGRHARGQFIDLCGAMFGFVSGALCESHLKVSCVVMKV